MAFRYSLDFAFMFYMTLNEMPESVKTLMHLALISVIGCAVIRVMFGKYTFRITTTINGMALGMISGIILGEISWADSGGIMFISILFGLLCLLFSSLSIIMAELLDGMLLGVFLVLKLLVDGSVYEYSNGLVVIGVIILVSSGLTSCLINRQVIIYRTAIQSGVLLAMVLDLMYGWKDLLCWLLMIVVMFFGIKIQKSMELILEKKDSVKKNNDNIRTSNNKSVMLFAEEIKNEVEFLKSNNTWNALMLIIKNFGKTTKLVGKETVEYVGRIKEINAGISEGSDREKEDDFVDNDEYEDIDNWDDLD